MDAMLNTGTLGDEAPYLVQKHHYDIGSHPRGGRCKKFICDRILGRDVKTLQVCGISRVHMALS